MESVIVQIISAISPSALPIVVCVLGLAYIYWKINSQRKVTKSERDIAHDDMDKRLTIVEHDVKFMKEQNQLFSSKLDRILDELTAIKVDIAKHIQHNMQS